MDCLDQILEERCEKALWKFRKNAEYMALLTKEVEMIEGLRSRILDKQIREEVMSYDEQKNAVGAMQLKVIYKAGVMDAIKLLKAMSVISH